MNNHSASVMKIGVLIKEFDKLPNWQLRIIDEITRNPSLELSLLIKDGRKAQNASSSLSAKFSKLFKSKNVFGKIVFALQKKIEKKMFPDQFSVNKENIIKELNKIEVIELSPKRKGFLDIFSKEDGENISNYGLDIILRHEFNIIRGPILNASKYGIWSFHHGDNTINRGGPAGFWEIVLKQKSVGATLQQLTPELDGGLVIDSAYFNRHWSFIKTNRNVLEGSVSVLFKNIRELQRGNYAPKKSIVYYNPLYRAPNFKVALKYSFGFLRQILKSTSNNLSTKLFGTRYKRWAIFIGKGNFLNATLFRLKPVVSPKGEYWADPFIFKFQEENYVFFENYSYKTKRGKISCGKIDAKSLVDISDVLDLDYHLSFPYIFEDNGDIYLMPESNENKRLELYKCVNFPNEWKLHATAFEGEQVADSFFYTDDHNQRWLFLNKKADKTSPMDSELFIYQVTSLQLNNLIPHKSNPVIINSRKARNGGEIFKHEGKLYRPSQANIDGVYGRALNINQVIKLTIDEYIEKDVLTSYPNFKNGLGSMHHLHQTEDLFVIDAAYKKWRGN